jgi:lipoic acid synthetase
MRSRGEEIPAHLAHLDREDVPARQEAQAVVDVFGEGEEVHY